MDHEEKLERIEMVLASCYLAMERLVSAGAASDAVQLQADVIDRLESVALDLDDRVNAELEDDVYDPSEVQAKPRIKFKKGRKLIKKYLCCSQPKKSRDRRGKQIWVASCTWRAGQKRGVKNTTVGRPSQGKLGKAPRALFATKNGGISATKAAGGRRVPWCKQ